MIIASAERGARLDQSISAFFGRYGYAVRANQVLVGRSGARHELDVFAEKSDALTTFRLVIECKAWSSPIEKDVVTKLHYVMSDLGLHKGIVVSLAGARSGADAAARELGIELWGPNELRRHLGESVFSDVSSVVPQGVGSGITGCGWPFRSTAEAADRLIRAEGKGRLGLRTLEELVWFAGVWVPAHLARLTVAQRSSGRIRAKLTSGVGGSDGCRRGWSVSMIAVRSLTTRS